MLEEHIGCCGNQKDARTMLAVGEAVLQRGAGKTPHTLGQNFKKPVVFGKVRKWEKGPSAGALGDKA